MPRASSSGAGAPTLHRATPHVPERDGALRIAHFTMGRCNPDSANGVDKTVYFLARAQAALGEQVAVFSLTGKPALPIPGVTVATYAPVFAGIALLGDRMGELVIGRSPFNLPRRLVAELLAWRPDILHLHFVHVPQNVRLARLARRAGIPYCVTINGGLSAVAQARHKWQKRIFALMVERRYLARAAFLHAISGEDERGLGAYGVSNHTVIAPNGIDVASLPSPIEARADTSGTRVLLFLGRLDPDQKGLDLLLRGFAACGSSDVTLVLVGPDWRGSRARLESLASELGIGARVTFAGAAFGAEKAALLASADLFVHPSRWEAGAPFSVLEAAAMGKPLLLTAPTDPSGLFVRGGAAIGVAADVMGVRDGIARALGLRDGELAAMGARARAIVEREFDWTPIARTVIDAYRSHATVSRG